MTLAPAEAYEGKTGPDCDQLIDVVADACSKDDPATLAHLFGNEGLIARQCIIS
ncbi:hypothetical protein ACIOHS_46975 [Streptomyces sp. NPDC088253]|uniref:hypothetical protein n=1 Tax=Streptomyces sp. NPDC088253 TaxID=3365846 RepID=UPI003803448E